MSFAKIGDSQILKVASVENGKIVPSKKHVCAKCGNAECTCTCIKKIKVTEGKNESHR